ncbi:MAG TPA: CaiB/BaiF CoA-transferase family protein [Chryseosolibacter sp.]
MNELKDLVVLELASVLAGPGAGQFFAELGASVIKVENLKTSGDVTRGWKSSGENTDDRSAYFCSVNWGKQSIAVDLSTLAGQDIVSGLASRSDIVIASYKPGDAEKLRVDYKTLSKENPALIYGQITGYGSSNPRVGYDAVIQAESGFMYLNGEPGGRSLKMPVALMDVLASHHLKEGLLLALLERARTGKGQLVEVSLIDAAVASLANQATNFLVGRQLPEKKGSAHPNIAPYGDVFTTVDGKEILLAVGTDGQFARLCSVLKIHRVSEDDRFKANVLRVRNRAQLNTVLAAAVSEVTAADLMKALTEEKIPAGLVRNVREVMTDPDLEHIRISKDSLAGIRTYVGPGMPDLSSHILPPPHFGEHTRAVLAKMLKFSPTAIEELFLKGIIQ